MADFDGMNILRDEGTPTSGGVFVLGTTPREDALQPINRSWYVQVRKHSKCVLVRGPALSSYEEARDTALEMAQRGLDLLVFRGVDPLQVVDVEREHVTWWAEHQDSVVRAVFVNRMSFSISAIATVVHADGKAKAAPADGKPKAAPADGKPKAAPADGKAKAAPPPGPFFWHDSFRYYRLSQTADDLFDAYRNLYLALESLLSTVVPIRASEGESAWLRRAFEDVQDRKLVDFSGIMRTSDRSPWKVAYSDLYEDKRNAIFHAKNHRQHLVPHGSQARHAVRSSLGRLAWVYLALARAQLGVGPPSGGMTPYAFQRASEWLDHGLQIHVTDDDTPFRQREEDMAVTGAAGQDIALATEPARQYDGPFTRFFLGTARVQDLRNISHVGRIISRFNGKPMTGNLLAGRLTLLGVSRFEVQMGIGLTNAQQPRTIYST